MAIEAQKAFSAHDVVGFLICALVRPPRLTGLLFGDQTRDLPDGLPICTPAMTAICEERGFTVVKVEGGDVYVVAHWLHENGEIDRFDRVH